MLGCHAVVCARWGGTSVRERGCPGRRSVAGSRLLGSGQRRSVCREAQVSEMNKDAQLRATINQKLIETGERERLKELLRAKLTECGWKDQLKAHCKDVIREKGLEHVTVDDLVAEITPKGRALVPDSVKKELLQRIRTFLSQHASL